MWLVIKVNKVSTYLEKMIKLTLYSQYIKSFAKNKNQKAYKDSK